MRTVRIANAFPVIRPTAKVCLPARLAQRGHGNPSMAPPRAHPTRLGSTAPKRRQFLRMSAETVHDSRIRQQGVERSLVVRAILGIQTPLEPIAQSAAQAHTNQPKEPKAAHFVARENFLAGWASAMRPRVSLVRAAPFRWHLEPLTTLRVNCAQRVHTCQTWVPQPACRAL